MPAHRDQLGGDSNPNLFGRDRTYIQPDRGVHPLKQVCGDAFALQGFENFYYLPLRSNHAYIASAGLHGPAQNAHVIAVPAGDDHKVRRLAGIELLHRLVEIECVNFMSAREALLGRIGRAIIGHDHVKSGACGRPANAHGDMACPE